MDNVVKVLVLIVGVAIVAVLVSSNSQTSNVITNSGDALAAILKAAVGPVSGGNYLG